MSFADHAVPPTVWCDWWTEVHALSPDIAYGWVPPELRADPGDPNPWFWHWCSASGRWEAQAAPDHTLISRDPLHMEPSLLWPCCGTHGWVRGGQWINA
ncbi:hypothetical protein ACFYRN_24780 [Streptomyces sp. NPDC005227]|uniref:hypothetical protein n=1 Tax=Streptomyces sp. NPDC005227 TaxID=3364707 RepID=UPI003692542C